MFNLFWTKKSKETLKEEIPVEENTEILASITYLIKRGSETPLIDVAIDDYNEESIQALATILSVLSEDDFFVDTINIIKTLLMEDNKTDILIKLFSKIHNEVKAKTDRVHANRVKDQPCVKPSEMFNT